MPDNLGPPAEPPAVKRRRARRFRTAAGVVLALGIIIAGAVYWLSPRPSDDSNDPAMLGYNRATDRQMAVLYGKQGQLIEELENTLKEPGPQAILIVIAAAIVAGVCFFAARVLESEADNAAVEGGDAG